VTSDPVTSQPLTRTRLLQPAGEALVPFVAARVVVLGALGLAHFIVDRTQPAHVGVAARVHEGLLGWDAGFYETIARVGYAPLGSQALRFYPAVPLLTHGVATLPGVGYGAALIIVSNVAAFVATVLLYVLVRRELGEPAVARRTIWILSLAPAAFTLVMGYAESTLLCLAIGTFLALRPSPDNAAVTRPNFALAALLGFFAALTRPIGILLALAVVAELVRWWPRLSRSRRIEGLGAVVAPVVGLVVFLWWSHHEVGDFWAPLRVQFQSTHHGSLSDPFVTVYHDLRGLGHSHVGTALHVPWVIIGLGLLVVCWRRLPASYTVFTLAVLVVAVAGSNLDSFERYALSAFPLSMAAALLCARPLVERTVLVLLPAALAGYALLAFLNISVP
jgi:Mannosyltransferase (PIG-V)